jgi:hypothetical protein
MGVDSVESLEHNNHYEELSLFTNHQHMIIKLMETWWKWTIHIVDLQGWWGNDHRSWKGPISNLSICYTHEPCLTCHIYKGTVIYYNTFIFVSHMLIVRIYIQEKI